MQKQEIEFPVIWKYKIMTITDSNCLKEIKKVITKLGDNPTVLKESNRSKTGKYTSYSYTRTVFNREELQSVGDLFSKIDGVKYVL